MRLEDIELEFYPSPGPAGAEQEEWRGILAAALATDAGSATAVFEGSPDGWTFRALRWQRPGAWVLQIASAEATAPLYARVLSALRAAGKKVSEA